MGKSAKNGPFSMAMLNNQMVTSYSYVARFVMDMLCFYGGSRWFLLTFRMSSGCKSLVSVLICHGYRSQQCVACSKRTQLWKMVHSLR